MAVIVAGALLCVMITSRSGADETFVEGQERYGALLDNLFYIIYAVGIACGAAAILFGLYFFVTNLKEKMGTLIGVAGFVVIGLVSFYGLADSTVLRAYEASGITVTEGESMFAGGGMYFVYLLGAVALASILLAEVNKAIK
jgi:predicted cobalt transporter CbtA